MSTENKVKMQFNYIFNVLKLHLDLIIYIIYHLQVGGEAGDGDVDKSQATSSQRGGRRPQFRWNPEKDLMMVIEIEKLQPFSESSKRSVKLWSAVADVVNNKYHGAVDYLAVKRRFERILTAFEKDDMMNRNK